MFTRVIRGVSPLIKRNTISKRLASTNASSIRPELYPLIGLIGSAVLGASAFGFYSLNQFSQQLDSLPESEAGPKTKPPLEEEFVMVDVSDLE